MAEAGSRRPASSRTAADNAEEIAKELTGTRIPLSRSLATTNRLRKELEEKGLEGFKKGGKVKKTGKAKVHKGEYVIKKAAAKKLGSKKLGAMNRGDVAMLKRAKA